MSYISHPVLVMGDFALSNMQNYKNQTLKKYLDKLSGKTPVPGGGSAAALTAATGVALISMVSAYSKGRSKSKKTEARISKIHRESEKIKKRILTLVDLDAKAYMNVIKARGKSDSIKRAALKRAQKVPYEVSRLCYKAVKLTPFLVKNGNKNLISDISVAVELLLAGYNSAMINVRINA